MNGPGYRAGVMRIAKGFTGGARTLPPEHRVAAVAEVWDGLSEDWLVEGPTLPLLPASGVPLGVCVLCSVVTAPESEAVTLTACWRHAPDQPWHVGNWPSFRAFQHDVWCEEQDGEE